MMQTQLIQWQGCLFDFESLEKSLMLSVIGVVVLTCAMLTSSMLYVVLRSLVILSSSRFFFVRISIFMVLFVLCHFLSLLAELKLLKFLFWLFWLDSCIAAD